MKRIIACFLVFIMVAMMVPTLPVTAASENVKIEPDGETIVHFPFDTYYMGGNTYKKYVIGGNYEGLVAGDIIFVDSEGYLITEKELIDKLLFTSIIRQNINVRTHAIEIDQWVIELSEALDIVNVLGDMLVEKTIADGIKTNFDAICKGEMATAYAGFIASSAVQSTMYLSYLMNVYALVDLCVKNIQDLDTFIGRLEDEVQTIGLAYEDAQTYERLVKNCYGALEAFEKYLIYLAECASDSVIDNQIDAIDVLKNVSSDQIDDQIKTMFEEDFGIKNFSSIIEHCKSFLELAETVKTTLAIEDSIQAYTQAYEVCGSSNIFYIDVDDVMGNVGVLTTDYDKSNSNTNFDTTLNLGVGSIDSTRGSFFSDNETIATKIDTILAQYVPGNSYFTKNGKPCSSCHTDNSFSCVNSPQACNCLRYVTIDGKSIDLKSAQCFAYARYWQQMLFGSHETNSSNFKQLSGVSGTLSGDKTKNWFVKNKDVLHPGTHIRVYGKQHSIVLLGVDYDKGTVTYIQCNWVKQDVNKGDWCKVSNILTKTWAEFAKTFSTLSYAQVYEKYYEEYPQNQMQNNVLTINYNANGGMIDGPNYYLVGDQIYKKSTSKLHVQTCTYGVQVDNGLYNDTTFGMYRDGYTFKGWSFSATGGTVIDQNMAFKPEEIVPSVANGNVTVTAYAVWEQDVPPVTDHTVESIYISSIPQKDVYYVGDQIDLSAIKLIVKHTDGSFEQVTSGFVCTPATISKEGKQDITVTYQDKTATFSITATKSKPLSLNATVKTASDGYFLPTSSAGSLPAGTAVGDQVQILCRDGDFYLCLFPWGGEVVTFANGALLYIKTDTFTVTGNIPTSSECFTMNPTGKENGTILSNAVLRFRPDGGVKPIQYNGVSREQTVNKDTRVKVLFEMNGQYCIQTDKYTGFVDKSAVKLDSVPYTVSTNISNITVNKGETVNTSSITVTETMTDGTTAAFPAKDCTVVLPSTASAGQKKMLITKDGLSVLVNVTVTEPQVTGITIEKTPSKMVYALGESFDPAGLVVKATYDNGAIEDITSKVTFAYAFEGEGESLIGVKYGSFSKYFSVKVYEKPTVSFADIDGYAGQTIKIPVFFFANEEIIVPATFDIAISYDSAKLQYMGIENSELYTVTAADGTLRIAAKNSSAILDCILVDILFKLKTDVACYNTSAEITIDQLTLSDSLGNQYTSVLGNGQISNLGQIAISFFATDDTDTEFMVKKANYAEIIQVPDTIPVLNGFVFKGWKDVQNKTYQPGDPITATENLALYAVWETATYSVIYNANGGENAPAEQTKIHGTDLTLSATIPTRAGYTFMGWAACGETSTAEYSAGGSYTANSDVTLYAVWEKIVEDTTTSTSESTRETTSTSESTRETTSTSESTRETTSAVESTRETTSAAESTRETTSTSESTRETTSAIESTRETTSTSESTRETTSAVESTRETTTAVESTRETTSTSESTRETTSAVESTRETTSASESTRETTSTSESTRETTSASESTSEPTSASENSKIWEIVGGIAMGLVISAVWFVVSNKLAGKEKKQ